MFQPPCTMDSQPLLQMIKPSPGGGWEVEDAYGEGWEYVGWDTAGHLADLASLYFSLSFSPSLLSFFNSGVGGLCG